jgi:hypothetical protein
MGAACTVNTDCCYNDGLQNLCQDNACCIVTGNYGCGQNSDCCSGLCDTTNTECE